jgi:DegV family protein with EDD domain
VRHYGIVMTSSSIVVDGESHDVHDDVTLREVDAWVAAARVHPYVLGTSAAEIARCCLKIGEEDDEILIVMSSRKIIPSFDSACSAARTLEGHPVGRKLRIRVVDSTSTDLGLGLPVLAAAEAARAGLGFDTVGDLIEVLASRGRFAFVPRSIDNLVRGGRASFLRGWMAKMLGLRPMLAFVDGEPGMVGKCKVNDDHPRLVAAYLRDHLVGRVAWIGVSHGGTPEEAERTADELRSRFEAAYVLVRPLTPTVYLHAGPQAIGAVAFPLDDLPWMPPAPPADLTATAAPS